VLACAGRLIVGHNTTESASAAIAARPLPIAD